MLKRLFLIFSLLVGIVVPLRAEALEDYSCLNFMIVNSKGLWSFSEGPEVTKAVITWSIIDPGNCIVNGPVGPESSGISWRSPLSSGDWESNWSSSRNGDNYVIINEFDIPNTWLNAMAKWPGIGGNIENGLYGSYVWSTKLIQRKISTSKTQEEFLEAIISPASIWSQILSKRQNLNRDNCRPGRQELFKFDFKTSSKISILSNGEKPRISIELSEPSNCIFLINTPEIGKLESKSFLNTPFWNQNVSPYSSEPGLDQYWENLFNPNRRILSASSTYFGKSEAPDYKGSSNFVMERDSNPLFSKDSLNVAGDKITILSELDLSKIDKAIINSRSEAQIVIGVYSKYSAISSCAAGGWTVDWTSRSSFTMRYSKGGCTPSGVMNSYQVVSATIPLLDLLQYEGAAKQMAAKQDSDAKAAAELKAKQEAEAKAAAELKAKQEAEAKAAAELKAKQEAEAKAAAELKAKQEAEAKAAAELKAKQEATELKAKQEAEAKAAAELKAKKEEDAKTASEQKFMNEVIEFNDKIYWLGEKFPSQKSVLKKYSNKLYNWIDAPFWLRDYIVMEKEFDRIRNEVGLLEIKWNKSKKTISCIKANKTIRVTDVKPKCPSGYRVK
jgi:hypothetical protein